MRDIGKNIKQLREGKGMTQEILAEQLFVTRQTVSNYETGRTRPDIEMLLRIAQVLETDANTVLYGLPLSREKADRKRLLLAAGVFLLLGLLVWFLRPVCLELRKQTFLSAPYMAVELLLEPAVMLLGGWTAMQAVGLLLKVQPLAKARQAKFSLLGLLGVFLLILLPFLIWSAYGDYLSIHSGSVSTYFPNNRIYSLILYYVTNITTKYCVIYALLGAGLWITGFPAAKMTAAGED